MTDFKELESLTAHLNRVNENTKLAATTGVISGSTSVGSIIGACIAGIASPIVGVALGAVGSGIAYSYLNKKIQADRSIMDEKKLLNQELDYILDNIKAGKYGNDSSVIKPEIVSSEDDKVIISVPVSEGTVRRVFERNSNGEWTEVPYIGETQDFA